MLWIVGRFIKIIRAIAISAQSVIVRPMTYDRPLRVNQTLKEYFSLTYNGLRFLQHTP